MKHILCFGDSNTFGWDPDGLTRFDQKTRWPGLLSDLLGSDYHVIEEGLGGRTTAFNDPDACGKYGKEYLYPCVQSHQPLDLVIIMLGTNDMKAVYSSTAQGIGDGLEELIKLLQTPAVWDTLTPPEILIISPVHIGDHLLKTPFSELFGGVKGIALSKELAEVFHQLANKYNCAFLDAAQYAEPSDTDAIHMNQENHKRLAAAVYDKIRSIDHF